MAVQREIVDKDGNRLTVVQGGAGKSAVYGKTAAGEWVPLQVDADGRAVLNVGEVSATIGVVEQGAAGEDPWPVQINGSKARLSSAPATGVKTVTATAAEVFAGASRKAGRSRLAIRNLDPAVRIRIGHSSVTDTTGYGIEPRAMVEIDIDPLTDVPIYAISEAGYVSVEVFEG